MKKLIYIYPQKSSFINSDVTLLSKHYDVKTQDLEWSNPKKLVLNWFLQQVFLLRNVWKSEAIVISFAGYFSLIPVLFGSVFGIKTLLILNGTDCVSFPEYNYGSLRKKLLRFFIKYSQQFATKLLPVDASLIQQEHTFDEKVTQTAQGFLTFFSKLKTPISVIPNGFDTTFWTSASKVRSSDFITVVSTTKKSTAIFKGVDLILEVAKKYPQKIVTIVGLPKHIQQEFSVSENVKFIEFVPKETLRKLYSEHQFYMQLSINEGFGCALSEAMLCGCIPIVAKSGALPNVAGNDAFLVEKRTSENLLKIVNVVSKLSENYKKELSNKARNHIFANFGIDRREKSLLKELQL